MRSGTALLGMAMVLARPAEAGTRRLRKIYTVPEDRGRSSPETTAAMDSQPDSWLWQEEDLVRYLTEGSFSMSYSMSMGSNPPGQGSFPPPGTPSTPNIPPQNRDDHIGQKCGVSAAQRSAEILTELSTVTDMALLTDPTSTRYKARMWIDSRDEAVICSDSEERLIQRYILALFYYQMGGPGWNLCRAEQDHGDCPAGQKRFLDGSNECDWLGTECASVPEDPDTYVNITQFVLKDNNLQGELFDELYHLTAVTRLFLDTNQVSGSISPAIAKLTALEELDIDDNLISGSLPDELFGMTTLKVIDMDSNQLTGMLSSSIGNLTLLEVLQLENNNFVGDVPSDGLLLLENLLALTLDENNFTGSVEPICDIQEERREENPFYLMFFIVDCGGTPPKVECSCCTCPDI